MISTVTSIDVGGMAKEKTREPKPTEAAARRHREQKKALSSLHHNKRHHLSDSGDSGKMGGWKGDDGEMGSGGSDGGDEDMVRPPPAAATTTSSINTKKRVKLNAKVEDNYYCAVVPRKLRSAISRRSNESVSPPVPIVKRKDHCSHNVVIGVQRSLRSMENDSLTEDEEEVIQTLSALASIAAVTKPANNGTDRKSPDGNGVTKTITSVVSCEAAKAKNIDFPSAFAGANSANTPPHTDESSGEAEGVKHMMGADMVVQPGFQNIDLQLNNAAQADYKGSSSFVKNRYQFSGIVNTSCQTNTLLHAIPSNGKFQFMQLEAPLLPETVPLPVMHASAAIQQETNSLQAKSHTSSTTCWADMWNSVPTTSASADLTGSFPTKPSEPVSVWFASRPGSTANGLSNEKVVLGSAGSSSSWKKGAKHMYISHFIRNYQRTGKKHQRPASTNQHKPNHGAEFATLAGKGSTVEKSGLSNPLSSGVYTCIHGGNCRESTTEVHNGMTVQPDNDHKTSYGNQTQMKPVRNFLSLSACGESNHTGKGTDVPGKVPIPYLQPLPPHHQLSLPPGQYPSPYTEQLAAQQPPNYILHPFYGLQMGRSAGATSQQQQQMWQAHYRPLHVIPKYQNGRPQDATLIPSSWTDNRVSLRPFPPIHHQILPKAFPATTTSSGKKQHQQAYYNQPGSYEGSALRTRGSVQLQLLCNVQRT